MRMKMKIDLAVGLILMVILESASCLDSTFEKKTLSIDLFALTKTVESPTPLACMVRCSQDFKSERCNAFIFEKASKRCKMGIYTMTSSGSSTASTDEIWTIKVRSKELPEHALKWSCIFKTPWKYSCSLLCEPGYATNNYHVVWTAGGWSSNPICLKGLALVGGGKNAPNIELVDENSLRTVLTNFDQVPFSLAYRNGVHICYNLETGGFMCNEYTTDWPMSIQSSTGKFAFVFQIQDKLFFVSRGKQIYINYPESTEVAEYTTNAIPEARYRFCALPWDDQYILYFGGHYENVPAGAVKGDPGKILRKVEVVSVMENAPTLVIPDNIDYRLDPGCAVVSLGGSPRMLVAGGFFDYSLFSVEMYEVGASTWQTIPPMTAPRHASVVVPVVNGFLVAGGYRKQDGYHTHTDVVEKYDFGLDSWQTMDPVASARQDMTHLIITEQDLKKIQGVPPFTTEESTSVSSAAVFG